MARPRRLAAGAFAPLATVDEASQTVRQAWVWPKDDELDVLQPIAMAASELLIGADLRRLERCARPWLFLDQSKNTTAADGVTWGLRQSSKIERAA